MPYSRAFQFFWASRDVAALGNGILFVALLAWSYYAQEKAIVVSIALVALLLPPFLLGPLANHLVRGPKAYPVAILAQLATIAALAPLLSVATAKDLWLALAAAFASAIPSAFLRASCEQMARSLVEGEQRDAAKRTMANGRLLILIVAPAIAAVLYETRGLPLSGLQACAAIAMATLAFSTLLLLLARPSRWDTGTTEKSTLGAELAILQQGLLSIWRHPKLKSATTAHLSVVLLTGGLVVIQVALMIWGVFTSAEKVGYILAAQALGIAVVTVGYRLLHRALPANGSVAIGLGLISVGIFGLSVCDGLTIATCCGLATGLGLGLLGSTFGALVLSFAPAGKEQTVGVALALVTEAVTILSITLLGPLIDVLTTRYAASLLSILFALLAMYSFGMVPASDMAGAEKETSSAALDTLYHDVATGATATTPAGR